MKPKLNISKQLFKQHQPQLDKYPQTPSPLNTTDMSIKRRPFMRKPTASPSGRFAESQRKSLERSGGYEQKNGFYSERTKKTTQQSQTPRPASHKFDKSFDRQESKDQSGELTKEQLFIPSFSQKDLIRGIKFINHSSLKLQTKSFRKMTLNQEIGENSDISKEQIIHQELNGKSRFARNSKQEKRLLKIADQSSSNSLHLPPKAGRKDSSVQQSECSECKKNKEKLTQLQKRCAKLEEDKNSKDRKIRQYANKLNEVLKDKEDERKYNRELIKNMQQRIREGEDELLRTFQTAKQEISKLKQTLKYIELENRVLLRYKNETETANQEQRKLRSGNDKLKRQLISIAGMVKQEQKNKRQDSRTKKQFTKEEDLISLQLSQCSTEHH